jgi:hypothetical protein
VIGFEPVVHTTVSVLTITGATVTLADNPFDDGGSSSPPQGGSDQNLGNSNPGAASPAITGPGLPQTEGSNPVPGSPGTSSPIPAPGSFGTSVPGPGPENSPSPITFNGAIIIPAGPGRVLVNGQTISVGSAGTTLNGIPISVATGGIVVVGGSSVTLPSQSAAVPSGSGSPTSSGVGAAIATGIGATKNNAFVGGKGTMVTFEAGVFALVLGGIGFL